MYGRTYDDHRFSPLNQINEQTVGKLGLAWSRELGTTRGLEATPLVEDGIIYTTGTWSVVYAIDAKTGEIRWTYDPKVPRERAYLHLLRRGESRRGALSRQGVRGDARRPPDRARRAYRRSGVDRCRRRTAPSHTRSPALPASPRGMVVIGNAGAEYGVRGYISAYDAETGKMAWRFYTVPGDPSKGFRIEGHGKRRQNLDRRMVEDRRRRHALGRHRLRSCAGPAVFRNGQPHGLVPRLRGGGDSLYTASILAVHASNGELAWYFQTTPGDNWDYDATQPLMQADLTIGGRARKVIMQANKNGFFYVLDRETGEFLSGTPFVSGITWATGLDPKTGRPIETPDVVCRCSSR